VLIIGSFNALPQRVLNLKIKKNNAYFKKQFFLSLALQWGFLSIGTLGVSAAANQEILLKGFNMQGDSSQQPLVMKGCFYLHVPICALPQIRAGILVLLLRRKFQHAMGQQDFSAQVWVPQRTRPCPRDAFVPANRGKTVGLHYLLPLYEQDTKAFLQQMDLQDRSHERFSRVLAQRLVCALPSIQTNGRYAPDRKQVYCQDATHKTV
jgi:hypothetical protein